MTSKELQNKLYAVECSLDMVDNDISILIEQLDYEKREIAKAYEELKGDKFVSHYLKEITFDLDSTVGMLNSYLETFRTHRSDTEEKNKTMCETSKWRIRKQ